MRSPASDMPAMVEECCDTPTNPDRSGTRVTRILWHVLGALLNRPQMRWQVARRGDFVLRPRARQTPAIHAFLIHLRERGLPGRLGGGDRRRSRGVALHPRRRIPPEPAGGWPVVSIPQLISVGGLPRDFHAGQPRSSPQWERSGKDVRHPPSMAPSSVTTTRSRATWCFVTVRPSPCSTSTVPDSAIQFGMWPLPPSIGFLWLIRSTSSAK